MTANQKGKSKMEDNSTNSMFAITTQSLENAATELAYFIVREENDIETIDAALRDRKKNLELCKTQLAELYLQGRIKSINLEGGLTPRAKIVRKYFKQAGTTDEQLFKWLNKNDLGGIIKPYVHFQTLQSALKDFECQGNILPDELFNVTDIPTVVMFGKSKYLQKTNAETSAAQSED
jgi:hypothetical protein